MREERLLALAIPSRVGVATCFPAHRPFVNRLQGAWLLHIMSILYLPGRQITTAKFGLSRTDMYVKKPPCHTI
jgi:hypothetical protein